MSVGGTLGFLVLLSFQRLLVAFLGLGWLLCALAHSDIWVPWGSLTSLLWPQMETLGPVPLLFLFDLKVPGGGRERDQSLSWFPGLLSG